MVPPGTLVSHVGSEPPNAATIPATAFPHVWSHMPVSQETRKARSGVKSAPSWQIVISPAATPNIRHERRNFMAE